MSQIIILNRNTLKIKKEKIKVFREDKSSFDPTFDTNSFDEKSYCNKLFETMDKESIRTFSNTNLLMSKELASNRLQESVHKNYPIFISTSKEISNLEVDMLELKNNLSEVNAVIKGMQQVEFNSMFNFNPQIPIQTPQTLNLIKDVHFLLELPDELDILISERLFENAVQQIEKVDKFQTDPNLSTVWESMKEFFEIRVQLISQSLLKDLQSPVLKKAQIITTISLLTRLGYSVSALEIFLLSRTRKIRNELKKIKYKNDASLYVEEVSYMVFNLIDQSCDDFLLCFGKNTLMTSGFIVWLVKEMDHSLDMFRRKIFYSSELDNFGLVAKCFEITRVQFKTLENKGLNLSFYLRQTFSKDLKEIITNHHLRMDAALLKHITEESWEFKSLETPNEKFEITLSCKYLNTSLTKFIQGILSIWTSDLVSMVVSTFTSLVENYFLQISQILSLHLDLNDRQRLAMISNLSFILNSSIPRNIEILQKQIGYTSSELIEFKKRCDLYFIDILNKYSKLSARNILESADWKSARYAFEEILNDNAKPSENISKLFDYLINTFPTQISKFVNKENVKQILNNIINNLVNEMSESPFWNQDNGDVKFGQGGVQQFILDLKFLKEALADYKSENIAQKIQNMIEHATLNYCTQKQIFKDVQNQLKPESWNKKIINSCLKK